MLKILYRVMCSELFLRLFRKLFQSNKLIVFLYHNPEAKILDAHLAYLSEKYDFISLHEAKNFIAGNMENTSGKPKALLTLDDGYKENFNLLQVFRKFKVRPTIYLVSDIVNTNRHFWQSKEKLVRENVKLVSDCERIKQLKSIDHYHAKEYEERQALNLSELNEMSPFVDFESHTQTHPILTKCEESKQQVELLQSKMQLEKLLDRSISSFAYPNGDFNDLLERQVIDSGYTTCVTVEPGLNKFGEQNFYTVKRVCIGDKDSVNAMKAKTTLIPAYLKKLLAK